MRIKQVRTQAFQHLVGELGVVVKVFPPGVVARNPDTGEKNPYPEWSYYIDLDHGPMMDVDGKRRCRGGHQCLQPIDDEERDALAQVTQLLNRLKAEA